MDEVWQEARRLLADRWFPLASKDAAAVGQREASLPQRIMSPAKATKPIEEVEGLLPALGLGDKPSGAVNGLQLDTGWVSQDDANIAAVGDIEAQTGLRRVRLRATGRVRAAARGPSAASDRTRVVCGSSCGRAART